MKKRTLTDGSIVKGITLFAIPIFIGQLFQQLYNVVDSIIVSRFDSDEAFGAITSTASLNFLFFGFISGIFIGAGVLVSRYFGSKNEEGVRKAGCTSIAFALVAGLILTILGVLLTPSILKLMNANDVLFQDSKTYLQIVFAGAIITALFNCANGIFQAVGDSITPLKFLIISVIFNVIFDLIFVAGFNLGVAGAALATVLSQFISVALSFYTLYKGKRAFKFKFKEIKFHKGYVKDIIVYGIPSGVSNSVMSIANVFIQSKLNLFDEYIITGSGAYLRVEQFAFIPVTSFAMSLTTFVSQNIGAKKFDRVKRGMLFGIATTLVMSQSFGLIFYLAAPQLVSIFTESETIIDYAVDRAKIQCLFYFAMAFTHSSAAVLRGAGKAILPMIVFILFWCVVRIIYINIALMFNFKVEMIYWAYPLTWCLSALAMLSLLLLSKWNKQKNLQISY